MAHALVRAASPLLATPVLGPKRSHECVRHGCRAGLLGIAILALALQAEIVDRIAASVGSTVITESDVLEDLRVSALLNGTAADPSDDQKRKALERLIDQELMRREIAFTRFPLPSEADVEKMYREARARFPNEEAYQAEVRKDELSDATVRQHLQWQLRTLRFIEYRFQPGVQVSDADIRREYDDFANQWRETKHSEPPAFEQVREEVERLAQQRLVDSALDRWLGEVRTQNDILYRKGYAQ